jgi:hypothetical protein
MPGIEETRKTKNKGIAKKCYEKKLKKAGRTWQQEDKVKKEREETKEKGELHIVERKENYIF